jgi:hypothetical protein
MRVKPRFSKTHIVKKKFCKNAEAKRKGVNFSIAYNIYKHAYARITSFKFKTLYTVLEKYYLTLRRAHHRYITDGAVLCGSPENSTEIHSTIKALSAGRKRVSAL